MELEMRLFLGLLVTIVNAAVLLNSQNIIILLIGLLGLAYGLTYSVLTVLALIADKNDR